MNYIIRSRYSGARSNSNSNSGRGSALISKGTSPRILYPTNLVSYTFKIFWDIKTLDHRMPMALMGKVGLGI